MFTRVCIFTNGPIIFDKATLDVTGYIFYWVAASFCSDYTNINIEFRIIVENSICFLTPILIKKNPKTAY